MMENENWWNDIENHTWACPRCDAECINVYCDNCGSCGHCGCCPCGKPGCEWCEDRTEFKMDDGLNDELDDEDDLFRARNQ